MDVITGSRVTDPEELVISREEFDDIEGKMGEILSPLEWQVLTYYLDGKTYQEKLDEATHQASMTIIEYRTTSFRPSISVCDENGDPELAQSVKRARQDRLIDAFLYASVTPAYLTAALDAL